MFAFNLASNSFVTCNYITIHWLNQVIKFYILSLMTWLFWLLEDQIN